MQYFSILVSLVATLGLSAAKFAGFQNVDELVAQVYKDQAAPLFVPLPGWPNIAVANNETALLKVMNLTISHYPIKKGRVTFGLLHELTADLPEGSTMDIHSFVDGKELYSGELQICDYLKYANLDCPLKKEQKPEVSTQVLQVPETAEDARLAFVATVNTPENTLVTRIAAIVDLEQDGTYAEEEQATMHDEL